MLRRDPSSRSTKRRYYHVWGTARRSHMILGVWMRVRVDQGVNVGWIELQCERDQFASMRIECAFGQTGFKPV